MYSMNVLCPQVSTIYNFQVGILLCHSTPNGINISNFYQKCIFYQLYRQNILKIYKLHLGKSIYVTSKK